MQRRLRSKLVYTSKDLLLPIAQSIQTKTLSAAQRTHPKRLRRFDAEHMTSAELQDLKARVTKAIQRKRLQS
jgi:hypothetical protein